MRPTLAIVPLALLLAWFGPSPSGEPEASGAPDARQVDARQQPEVSAAGQLAQAWASMQRSDSPQAAAEVAQQR